MGTWDSSKIRQARKETTCGHCHLPVIRRGDRYLNYKLGLRNDLKICLPCAKSEDDKGLIYDCIAARDFTGGKMINEPLQDHVAGIERLREINAELLIIVERVAKHFEGTDAPLGIDAQSVLQKAKARGQ